MFFAKLGCFGKKNKKIIFMSTLLGIAAAADFPYKSTPVLGLNILGAAKYILKGPFPASFFFIFVLSTVNRKYVHYKILLMTGFELRTSGIRSNRLPTEPLPLPNQRLRVAMIFMSGYLTCRRQPLCQVPQPLPNRSCISQLSVYNM